MRLVDVTVRYLEMRSRDQLKPKRVPHPNLRLARIAEPFPELNRFFYTAVGGDWFWTDRLPWTWEQWHAYLGRPGLETWMLSVGDCPAGYFELDATQPGEVEIVYFGLLSRYVGLGFGAHLLTAAVERAWQLTTERVWLHTCSLDHPHALAHYQARGFVVYREETKPRELPETPMGPWPGARVAPTAAMLD